MAGRYRITKTVSPDYRFGMIMETDSDGSVTVDLGYGFVKVNPKHVRWLRKDVELEGRLRELSSEGKTGIEKAAEEHEDESFLKGLGISSR